MESYCSNPQLVCSAFTFPRLLLAFVKGELGLGAPYTGNHSDPLEGRFYVKVMNENKRGKGSLIYIWLVMIYTLPQYLSVKVTIDLYMCKRKYFLGEHQTFSTLAIQDTQKLSFVLLVLGWANPSSLIRRAPSGDRSSLLEKECIIFKTLELVMIWVGHTRRLVHIFLVWRDQHSSLQDNNLI